MHELIINIPPDFINQLEFELPNADTFPGDFYLKDFEYEDHRYALYFYKVRDYGSYFWICNPLQIHERI
ncbi:MAG TPA: hypothetical protein VGN20_09875 [Mucilaginibacter sp.]|jgi:hypothetical protein